ncbi:MAG: hypothetical protein JSR47_11490 [Proteobacteria bacterium]|nr:hypothetical protein [Pseudomonadota bacterium]
MTTIATLQPSFAAGELSPFLYGRVDLAKFRVGARTLENFFVHPHGGVSNRPGTRFVGEVDDSAVRHRLIPFQFRASPGGQNYALVFGDRTMQVVLLNNGVPGFVESAPGVVYTIATPYVASDLATLKFVQSADTMTLTHPSYAPMKLTRSGHAAWTLVPIVFAPSTAAPTGLAATSGGSAATVAVTAINDGSGEESLPSASAGSSSASAGTWNWTAVAGCTNYNVYKQKGSVFGFVAQVQATSWTDSNLDPDVGNTPPGFRNPFASKSITSVTVTNGGSGYSTPTLTVNDKSGQGSTVKLTPTVSGGAITAVQVVSGGKGLVEPTIQISDGGGSGAFILPSFAPDGGSYTVGYDYDGNPINVPTYSISGVTVGSGGSGYHAGAYVTISTVSVHGGGAVLTPVISGGVVTAVAVNNGGSGYFDYPTISVYPGIGIGDSQGTGAVLTPVLTSDPTVSPQCSAYYQQRQAYAGTLGQPQSLWFSGVGAFNSMAVSSPTKDSDAITRTLVGQQVNEIRHMVNAGTNLMLMTSGAEWRCWPGPSSNALTPGACFTLPQTAHGSSHVPPIWTQNSLLFVKEKGSRVIELRYDAIQDLYQSFDMSVLAGHLLYDTAAQYQIREWALASEPFQIIWAVRSDGVLLGFTFMREHEVYAWHRHVTQGAVESVCTIAEPDGSGGYFDAVYLIVARTVDGEIRRYVERMAPRAFATIADAWFLDCALQYSGAPVTSVSGLDHLEGMTVSILGDGSVVPDQVVTDGVVALDGPYSKVTVGLGYAAQLETLNLELPVNGTLQGQMKKIAQVTVRVKDARGLQLGLEQGAVQEVKQRATETLGSAMQVFQGDWQVQVPSEWNRDGRLFCRQPYPLPVTILDLIPEVDVGG